MPDDAQWLTANQAAKLSGIGERAIRARLKPGHPDHIPNYARPYADGTRKHRLIDRKSFLAWLEAHAE